MQRSTTSKDKIKWIAFKPLSNAVEIVLAALKDGFLV